MRYNTTAMIRTTASSRRQTIRASYEWDDAGMLERDRSPEHNRQYAEWCARDLLAEECRQCNAACYRYLTSKSDLTREPSYRTVEV